VHQFINEQFAIGEAVLGPSFIYRLAIRLVSYRHALYGLNQNCRGTD